MEIRVERSKEFVERLKKGGIRGNDCVGAFNDAHKAKRLLLKGNYVITYHVLDQCQERGINTDLEETLNGDDFTIRSKVGPDYTPHLLLRSEKANLGIVATVDKESVVFITAFQLNVLVPLVFDPNMKFNFYF